jgi:type II secretion system protein J
MRKRKNRMTDDKIQMTDVIAPAVTGFTIIEILIALLISGIIVGVIYASYMGSLRIIYNSQTDMERTHMARILLNRIDTDLRCAFLRAYKEYLVFVGVDSGEGEFGSDTLTFTASNHRRSERNAPESTLCEVSYSLDPERDENLYILRREDPTLDEDPFSGGETRIIGEGVAGLDFEYYDGESWVPSWDSREEYSLPYAVRVKLLLREEEGEEEEGEGAARYIEYSTEVAVPLGGNWKEEEEEEEEEEEVVLQK